MFTPAALVNEMLDKLPPETWSNPDLKWIDPACGSGNFLYQVKLRLMASLKIEDKERHILENMLFGVELQRKNAYLCMFKLDPENKYNLNIACANSLNFDYWNHTKFDVVVGNPPYNNEKIPGNPYSSDLYPAFVDLGYQLLVDEGLLLFITPSRWFAKSNSHEFCYRMTQQYGLKALWHNKDNKLFANTDIKGGLSYFILQKGYEGTTHLNFLDDVFDVKAHPDILIVKNVTGLSIYRKAKRMQSLADDCCAQSHFGLQTNSEHFRDTKGPDDVDCFVSLTKGGMKYVPRAILRNQQDIDRWKVLLRAADGVGGDYTSYHILAAPGQVCSKSYICFCFDTEEEAKNFVSYFETRFFKYLMTLSKITQDIRPSTFTIIPRLDWSQSWDNNKIYKHFGFTPEEIQLIEDVVWQQ